MLSRPQTTLLAFLALSSFSQATWFEDSLREIIRRQDDTGSSGSSIPPVLDPVVSPTTTPASPATDSITTTSPPTTTTTAPSSTTTQAPSTASSTTTTSSGPASTASVPESSSTSSEAVNTPSPTVSDKSTVPPITTPSPTVIQITRTTTVDGVVLTSVSESTSTVMPTSTNPAELNQSNESSGSSMTPKTRSTVIGVVVGIGGAILLGGLAVVAWRIWGRKKSHEEGDDFDDYKRPETGADRTGNSSSNGAGSNPFQSTLESYHNPTKVNASSNF